MSATVTTSTRVPYLSYFFPAHNEEANLEGLVAEALETLPTLAETFEIMFNKPKYDVLPAKMKAIIANAVEASSADMSWKAIDRYSQDYIELQTKNNVKFYKTPDSVLQRQLQVWDQVLAKKEAENPMFKKVNESMRTFAQRAARWQFDTNVNFRMAFNHSFPAKKT